MRGVFLRVRLIVPFGSRHGSTWITRFKRAATLITGTGQKEPKLIPEWKKLLEEKGVQAVVAALPCDLHAACYLDVIAAGAPKILEFGVADETAWRAGLSCGGRIKVYVERLD